MLTPSSLGQVAANNVIVKQSVVGAAAGLAARAAGKAGLGSRIMGGATGLGAGAAKKFWGLSRKAKAGLGAGTLAAGHAGQDAIRSSITPAAELQDVIKHKTRYNAVNSLQAKDLLSKDRGGVNPVTTAGTSPSLGQMFKSPFRTYKAYNTPDENYMPKSVKRPMTPAELAKLTQYNQTTGAPQVNKGTVSAPPETYQQKAETATREKLQAQAKLRGRGYTDETDASQAASEAAGANRLKSEEAQGYDMDIARKNQGEDFKDPLSSPAAAGAAAAQVTGAGSKTNQILTANDPPQVMKIKLEARQIELLGIIAAAGGAMGGAPTPEASEATQELEELRRIQQAMSGLGEDVKEKTDAAPDNRTAQQLNWDLGL